MPLIRPRLGVVTAPASSFAVQNLVGASVNYDGHPTIPNGSLEQDIDRFDDDLAAAISRSGRQLAGPHGYSGNSWPTTFAGSVVSFAPSAGYSWSWVNVKIPGDETNWHEVVDGSWDSHCTTYVNSVPSNHNHVFILNHEPENDGTQPSGDGGTWENTYGPIWSQGQGRIANLVASLNRPNVFFAVCHMTVTFPTNGVVGSLGTNQRNPQNWDAWQYMGAAAKARTIFAPDGYTAIEDTSVTAVSGSTTTTFRCTDSDLTADSPDFAPGHKALLLSSGGALAQDVLFTITSVSSNVGGFRTLSVTPAFSPAPVTGQVLRRVESMNEQFDGCLNYVQNDGWGVTWFGITEHTLNNDIGVDDAATACVWREDIKPFLRSMRDASSGPRLGYYLTFNTSSGLASGVNGWTDTPDELLEFGRMSREFNFAELL